MSGLDLIGQVLHDTYRVESRIGQGGNGEVFAASHLRLSRRFAIKVLLPQAAADPDAVARFEREARITSAIGNPHIVEVVDTYTTDDGRPYLVMELLEGEDLEHRLERKGGLELAEAAVILRQACGGVGAAHRQGVVHRDLKPQNIFLCSIEGRDLLVKVLDFGTSKILGKPREVTRNSLLGTPHYMAPEQAAFKSEQISPRTDVYALGAILYRSLVGRPPFDAKTLLDLLYRIIREETPPLSKARPDLPESVCQVVDRALHKEPEQRHGSVGSLSRRFTAAVMAAHDDEHHDQSTFRWDHFHAVATGDAGNGDTLPPGTAPGLELTRASERTEDSVVSEPTVLVAHRSIKLRPAELAPASEAALEPSGSEPSMMLPTRVVSEPSLRSGPLVPLGSEETKQGSAVAGEGTGSFTDQDTDRDDLDQSITDQDTERDESITDPDEVESSSDVAADLAYSSSVGGGPIAPLDSDRTVIDPHAGGLAAVGSGGGHEADATVAWTPPEALKQEAGLIEASVSKRQPVPAPIRADDVTQLRPAPLNKDALTPEDDPPPPKGDASPHNNDPPPPKDDTSPKVEIWVPGVATRGRRGPGLAPAMGEQVWKKPRTGPLREAWGALLRASARMRGALPIVAALLAAVAILLASVWVVWE